MSQIYLISPPQIEVKTFSRHLKKVLATGLIPIFQLRLKNLPVLKLKEIARELKKICYDNNCLFLLNDLFEVALEIEADGVHLGAEDKSIFAAQKDLPENFLIGASCYDSKILAVKASDFGADYLSFGAFFVSKTKKSRGSPAPEILQWCGKNINLPTVAIGGINNNNCSSLVQNGADFIAVISYVWDHSSGASDAIKKLDQKIKEALQKPGF
jgi:thiamine-phosphate pyrophosphorylase